MRLGGGFAARKRRRTQQNWAGQDVLQEDEEGGVLLELLKTVARCGLARIVVDEFHELLDPRRTSWLSDLRQLHKSSGSCVSLWGLTGTPLISDFSAVARIRVGHNICSNMFMHFCLFRK
ncbi:unnamed protein product [Polarella glacialis]|uniref:Helicase ATP-binding domain-containing protein n=1 Tax=Polarella glacialis TaxID=89957 RepID=A0A813K2T0_POLGL|nr:unnamed protein product [Polarella glacialis]